MNNDKSQVFFEKPVEIMKPFISVINKQDTFLAFLKELKESKKLNIKNKDLRNMLKFNFAIEDILFIKNQYSAIIQCIFYDKINNKEWSLKHTDIFFITQENIKKSNFNLDFNIFEDNIEFENYICLRQHLMSYIVKKIDEKKKCKDYNFNSFYELNNDTIINIIKLNFNVFNELSKMEQKYHKKYEFYKKYQLDYNNLIPIFNEYIDELFNKETIKPDYMYKCEEKDNAPENKDKGECYYVEKEKFLNDFFDYVEKETTINDINKNDFLQVLSDKEIIFNEKNKNFEADRSFNKVKVNVLVIFKNKIELSITND